MTLRYTPFIALLAALANMPALHAQGVEIATFATVGRTGVRELGNPVGAGVSVMWSLGHLAGFRIEASRTTSSPRWTATTCDVYWPLYTECLEETVENDVGGMHVAASMVVAPLRRGEWRLEGILGASRINLEHKIAGVETGRLLNQTSDGEGAFSVSYGVAIVREGLGTRRLGARLEWHHASMSGNITTCPADAYCPPWWDGFGVDEARLGASWRL
jgi:hypothetical protein